jgi:drug/metabolite transporter (DMT)-like permease
MRWNLSVVALASSWGFVWIIADHLSLGALTIVFWRIGLSVLVCGVGILVSGRTDLLRIGKTWRWTLLLGPGLALLWFCTIEAMKLSSVAVAVLATYTTPVFLALFAPLFLPERLSRVVLFALPIAIGGLILIAFASNGGGNVRPLAIAIGVSGALVQTVLVIIQKHVVREVNPIGFSFWIDIFAVAALVPVLPFAGRVLPSAGELGYLAILGVIFTLLSGLVWLMLLRHVTAQAMGFFLYRARLGLAAGLAAAGATARSTDSGRRCAGARCGIHRGAERAGRDADRGSRGGRDASEQHAVSGKCGLRAWGRSPLAAGAPGMLYLECAIVFGART